MSKFISENQEAFNKKSWINDLMNNKVLNANLTEEYAHDVLEAVADETFPNLDAAIADLSLRTGLTAAEVGIIKTAAINMVQASDIPGEMSEEQEETVPGPGLAKTTTETEEDVETASSACDVKTAGWAKKQEDRKRGKEREREEEKGGKKKKDLPEEFKKHMFKKKINMKKKKSCSSLISNIREAWFQNETEAPSAEAGGKAVESNPERMGYPAELKYERLEVSAPGGEDSRPFEVKKYKEEAEDTKKVMGPKGEEFEVKVEMQRIPKGEKPANARLTSLRQIVAEKKSK